MRVHSIDLCERVRACAVSCVCCTCRNVDAIHVLALRAWAKLRKVLERKALGGDTTNFGGGLSGGAGAG